MIVQPYRPVTYTIGSVSSSGMQMPMSTGMQGMQGMQGMGSMPPQVSSGSPMTPGGL